MQGMLSIDRALVAEYLDRLDEVGRLPGGGVWRGAYSPSWHEARRLVGQWMLDAGLRVREDAAGNLFGRLDGEVAGPVVLVGSHIDSVYAGGKFDGPLGIVGALAAARALRAQQPLPKRPVEVFVSAEEENSRFLCNFWGGRAVIGTIDPDEAGRYQDAGGIVLADAMRYVGLNPDNIATARRDDVSAFLELHIEQGPVLDDSGDVLGIVETISGVTRTRATVIGRADHAGSTPIERRADALLAAAEMVVAVRQLAVAAGPPARATVGALTVTPNQPVIIAERVEFVIDCRHPVRASQVMLVSACREACRTIAARHGVSVETDPIVDQPPTAMDRALVELVDGIAARRGVSYRRMVSGPGHDAMILGRRFPSLLIFVPSRDGRSHSPAEFTPLDQLIPGVQVLADAVLALAMEPA